MLREEEDCFGNSIIGKLQCVGRFLDIYDWILFNIGKYLFKGGALPFGIFFKKGDIPIMQCGKLVDGVNCIDGRIRKGRKKEKAPLLIHP